MEFEGLTIFGTHQVTVSESSSRRTRTRNIVLGFALLLLFVSTALAQQGVVEDIVVHGNRRIPADTIKSRMFTRPGDVYDQAGIERDFMSLWNTGYFDDLRFEREETAKGWHLHVYVKEKPTIREIKYEGLNAISQSDVLDKFKELKVGLTQESQFDPTRVKKAEVVLKDLLAAHGHQFATIRTEVRTIPPAAVGITFVVKEGPKVKVGNIRFEGNKKVSDRYLRSAMRNLRPIGIPHSIFLENIFARTYDATKLQEDAERVRYAFQDKGYFKAIVQDPNTKIRDVSGVHWYMPWKSSPGKVVDITLPVEEGERYKLKEITFTGNKAITNTTALRRIFKTKDGEYFNRTAIGKGLEELRKAYGSLGYINFTSVPDTIIDEEKKLITLNVDIDEGKPFFVRRIEFQGNTTTRDKVIRRELALEEGNVYNSELWELSLLRLNQLNYFEALKPEQDSEAKRNDADQTVDITLKVKEKGKNSIGLTGGVSGLSGSFIGLNYETNNFLGFGETLNITASVGSRQRDIVFGFTEPYLFDRPLQAGFSIYSRHYRYDQAQQASISAGQQLNLTSSIQNALQNFSQNSTGVTLSASYPIRRSFKRLGITYSFDNSSVTTYSDASKQYFQYLAFRNVSGPNSLEGILTSKIVPNFSYNHIDSPMRPHTGKSLFAGMDIAGLGGNVHSIRPIVEYKQFFPMKGLHFADAATGHQTFGIRLQGSFITGWGGLSAPPMERFYQGGDSDLRGFDTRAISPVAFIADKATINITDGAGNTFPLDPDNSRAGVRTVQVPIYRLVYPGGDTSIISNFEYRMPIAGPVTLAAFTDLGWNFAVRQSQLQLSDQQISTLDTTLFGCATVTGLYTCQNTQRVTFTKNITPIAGSNYVTRMSTGIELQVIMPVVNAPLRIYYAYNPLRMRTDAIPPAVLNRSMFPDGDAGTYTYENAKAAYADGYHVREPAHTFRFTVATTF